MSPEDYERVAAFKWTVMPVNGGVIYARRSVWGEDGVCRTILLHRFVLGVAEDIQVDHRDRNGLDCRRENLRTATGSQNACNRLRKTISKHGFIGLKSRTPGAWHGCVTVGRKGHYTKTFTSPVLAAVARDILALRLHGEFAVLNFTFAEALSA